MAATSSTSSDDDREPTLHRLTVAFFFLGASAAMCFLAGMWGGSITGWLVVASIGAFFTACRIGIGLRLSSSVPRRWLGRFCLLVTAGAYCLWWYLALVFGWLLGWVVPLAVCVGLALLLAAAAATSRRPSGALRVPVVLPLGLWVALLLAGWPREEALMRCDDFLGLQPPLELIVETQPDSASCTPGESKPSGRFTRTLWLMPDDERVVFTTQGTPVPGGIDGAVCATKLEVGSTPVCVGRPVSKVQGMADLGEHGSFVAMQWGVETPSGSRGAVMYELSREGPLEVLDEHWFEEGVAEGFYEPSNSTLYMFTDEMDGIHRMKIPEFERLETLPPGLFTPGEIRYDPALGEGVSCGGPAGAAITGNPFGYRYFVDGEASPLERVSLTWGCDWDPVARKVYVTVPNLGLLDRIDYDTGRVEKRWFVGFGMRSVEYDAARRRIYYTNFLRGEISAFDERSEQVVDTWFVGRFSRWVQLTRGGDALLATGNLGLVRIPLSD